MGKVTEYRFQCDQLKESPILQADIETALGTVKTSGYWTDLSGEVAILIDNNSEPVSSILSELKIKGFNLVRKEVKK